MVTTNQPNDRPLRGLFVGDSLCFSDTGLQLIETEMSCIDCDRIPAIDALLFLPDEGANMVRLVVVDEAITADFIMALPRLRAKFPLANFALAFKHDGVARGLLAHLQANPALGPVGFLPMNINIDSWLSVVRLIATGEPYVPTILFYPDQADVQAQPEASEPIVAAAPLKACDISLTPRELQVLESAAAGKQNKIIADELALSQHTVKLHMHHIIAKLGVNNRTEAAIWFLGRGGAGQGV